MKQFKKDLRDTFKFAIKCNLYVFALPLYIIVSCVHAPLQRLVNRLEQSFDKESV